MIRFNMIKKRFIFFITGMFFMLFGFQNVFAVAKTIKITFVGDLGSGKTALRCKLCKEPFNHTKRAPTRKSNMLAEVIDYDENTRLLCQIWDTSGDETVKEQILNMRIPDSEFVALVVDLSTRKEKLKPGYDNIIAQAMGEWYPTIMEKLQNCKVILVGTKSDAVSEEELARLKRCITATKDLHYNHLETLVTSAITGEGIPDFFEIVKRCVDIRRADPISKIDDGAEDDAETYLTCRSCKKRYRETSERSSDYYGYCSTYCYKQDHRVCCSAKGCHNRIFPGEGVKGSSGEYCSDDCKKKSESWCTIL